MLHLVTRDLITHIIPALCPSVQALQSEMLLDGVFVKADEMWAICSHYFHRHLRFQRYYGTSPRTSSECP